MLRAMIFRLAWLVSYRALACAQHAPCVLKTSTVTSATHSGVKTGALNLIVNIVGAFNSSGSGALISILDKLHLDANLEKSHMDMKVNSFEVLMLEQQSQVLAAAATPVPSGADLLIMWVSSFSRPQHSFRVHSFWKL